MTFSKDVPNEWVEQGRSDLLTSGATVCFLKFDRRLRCFGDPPQRRKTIMREQTCSNVDCTETLHNKIFFVLCFWSPTVFNFLLFMTEKRNEIQLFYDLLIQTIVFHMPDKMFTFPVSKKSRVYFFKGTYHMMWWSWHNSRIHTIETSLENANLPNSANDLIVLNTIWKKERCQIHFTCAPFVSPHLLWSKPTEVSEQDKRLVESTGGSSTRCRLTAWRARLIVNWVLSGGHLKMH